MPYLPVLSGPVTARESTEVFAGYNHSLRIADGEFYETKNLSTREFPLLATRPRRGVLSGVSFTNLQAIIAKDALYWVDNGTLYANGTATGLTGLQTARETQLVSMGAYLCVFPDKKYINTMDLSDYGSMGASWSYTGPVTYTMCHQDGTIYTDVTKGPAEPESAENGDVWVDTSENAVKQYSEYEETWVVLETVYTRVDFTTQGQVPAAFRRHEINLPPVEVNPRHADLQPVAGLYDGRRIGDVSVGQLRKMHESVLMHSDVDERTECRDVRYDAFELHALPDVLDLRHVLAELRRLKRLARIASRFHKFGHDVPERRLADSWTDVLAYVDLASRQPVAD